MAAAALSEWYINVVGNTLKTVEGARRHFHAETAAQLKLSWAAVSSDVVCLIFCCCCRCGGGGGRGGVGVVVPIAVPYLFGSFCICTISLYFGFFSTSCVFSRAHAQCIRCKRLLRDVDYEIVLHAIRTRVLCWTATQLCELALASVAWCS